MRLRYILLSVLFLLFFTFFTTNCYASSVRINELSAPTGNDWIELYNPNSEAVTLVNWILKDSTGEVKKISVATVSASSFLTFDVSNRLNNGGDTISLYDQNNQLIDSYSYAEQIDDDVVFARKPDGGDWKKLKPTTKGVSNNSAEEVNQATPTPTPSPTPSATPTPTVTPETYTNIKITEVYPNPSEGNEWVELYNGNDFNVTLHDWVIKDGAENSRTISELEIAAKGYSYYAFSSGFFNNDGDMVKLFDNNKSEVHTLPEVYPVITKDKSWSFVDGDWCMTEPSKGAANNSCIKAVAATPTPTASGKSSVLGASAPPKDTIDSKTMLQKKDSEIATLSGLTLTTNRNKNTDKPLETNKKQHALPVIPLVIGGTGLTMMVGAGLTLFRPQIFTWLQGLRA